MLLRRVARPLLAAIFVSSGIEELINPAPKVTATAPLLAKGQDVMPTARNVEPATFVQADAAVKIGAGLMLAFGWAPRLAATALAVSHIPTTVVEHPFRQGPRAAQQTAFLKNAGLLGGLMLAAADTQGKPSAAWRTRRTQRDAARLAKLARRDRRNAARAGKLARKAAKARIAGAGSQASAWATKAGASVPSLR